MHRRATVARTRACSTPGCGSGTGARAGSRGSSPTARSSASTSRPGWSTRRTAPARAHGLDNCAFFQADVGDLPRGFTGKFDLVYNCLAHHHYPDPAAAAAEVLRCLRPGGVYCIVDPGPAWFTALSAPLARWADPGWIGFHTPDEFRRLLAGAGFARTAWVELLPGFGVAVGQKLART